MNFIDIAIAKGYTEESLMGAGALKGDKGDTGDSAYIIAVNNGFEGTEEEWLESLKVDESTVESIVNKVVEDSVNEISENISQLSGEIAGIADIFINLIDHQKIIKGAVDENSGNIETGFENYTTTDYIPVKRGESYYFSRSGMLVHEFICVLYSDTKNYYTKINNNNPIIPSVDGYIRISVKNWNGYELLNTDSELKSVNGNIRVKLKTENIPNNSITAEQTTFFDCVENLFNIDAVVVGAINSTLGILDETLGGWRTSDYIPVKAGTKYVFSVDGKSVKYNTAGFYNTAKQVEYALSSDMSEYIATADGYIRISLNTEFPEHFQIETDFIHPFIPHGEVISTIKPSLLPKIDISNYIGKQILFMGDSITALNISDRGWVKYFNEILKPSKSVNVAVVGASCRDKNDTTYDGNPVYEPSNSVSDANNVLGNQVQKVIDNKTNGNTDYDNFDLIIVACGTNDGNYLDYYSVENAETVESEFIINKEVVPLENVNRKTFAGAIRYTYEKLHNLYPNAQIFFCSPIQENYASSEPYYSTLGKRNLIKYITERLSVGFIDSFVCGICNLYNKPNENSEDLQDGIHPNENGAKKLGRYIAHEVINKLWLL